MPVDANDERTPTAAGGAPVACPTPAAGAPRGHVALVGAGPGDLGLLTRRAAELLGRCDVVVYDRLINDELLVLCPGARRIYVGKRVASHPVPQHEINQILVREGLAGRRVVRLKGGDPYIFGRGGEEARELAAAGVPFEVVPGVTSAVAALSYAGIPATDRSCAASVHFVTGHRRENGELGMDFDALARVGGTLVFMMAVSTTPEITRGLLSAGMDPSTPAAMVERGTTARQRRVDATLATVADASRDAGVASPAILVVGEVCALAVTLDWYDKLPLRGLTVAVTRPADRVGTLTRRLRELGADVIEAPCIETRPVPSETLVGTIEGLRDHAWVVLTSTVGVRCLFDALRCAGRDARWLAGVGVAAIGSATADELRRHQIEPDLVPDVFDGTHLAADIAVRSRAGERVLLFRSAIGSPELSEGLVRAGLVVDDKACYETVLVGDAVDERERARIEAGEASLVTFTSASTADGFVKAFPELDPGTLPAVCIGPMCAAAAERHGFACATSERATIDSLVEAVVARAAELRAASGHGEGV